MSEGKVSAAERSAADILAPLRVEERALAAHLTNRTLHRIHAWISTKEIVELATSAFVLGVCAPALDMVLQLIRSTEGGEP